MNIKTKEDLKDLFSEILDEYVQSEELLIVERSTNDSEDREELGKKIASYQVRFSEILGEYPPSQCPHCGAWFRPGSTVQIYCTPDCYRHARAKRNYPRQKARRMFAKGKTLEEIALKTGLSLCEVKEVVTT